MQSHNTKLAVVLKELAQLTITVMELSGMENSLNTIQRKKLRKIFKEYGQVTMAVSQILQTLNVGRGMTGQSNGLKM